VKLFTKTYVSGAHDTFYIKSETVHSFDLLRSVVKGKNKMISLVIIKASIH